jgi:selenocysteine-specific elongation factor
VTPHAWRTTDSVDVRLERGDAVRSGPGRIPANLMLHVGSLAVQVRTRPLGGDAVRLTLPAPLALTAGDRLVLRDPGSRHVVGALVVDADPPPLRRRGAAVRRAEAVAGMSGTPDLAAEVARREAMATSDAAALGLPVPEDGASADGVARRGRWLVADAAWQQWGRRLHAAAVARADADPLDPTLTLEAARAASGAPDRTLVPDLAGSVGLDVHDGRVGLPGRTAELGDRAEEGLRRIEARLADEPFAAPEQKELDAAGLGGREVAAAVRAGRLLRLTGVPDDVYLQPIAPARAMRVLAGLPQPFTTSEARVALASTRRTVVPLLEHLDARGWTRRVDGTHREVRR